MGFGQTTSIIAYYGLKSPLQAVHLSWWRQTLGMPCQYWLLGPLVILLFLRHMDRPRIADTDDIDDEFEKFLEEQKTGEFERLCEEESLDKEEVRSVVETYLYDQRKPLSDDIAKTLQVKPKLLERKKIIPRVLERIMEHIEKFYEF